jgi:hypothetical protein
MHRTQAGVPVLRKPEQATDGTRGQRLLPVFMRRPDSSGRHPRMCSGSADPRLWDRRFFRIKNRKSHEEESALGFGGSEAKEEPQTAKAAVCATPLGGADIAFYARDR